MPSTREYRSRPEVVLKAREYGRRYKDKHRSAINTRARARKASKKEQVGLSPACSKITLTDDEERKNIRAYGLKKKYGLTIDQWDSLFEDQGRCCAICHTLEPGGRYGWQTDHCHSSGKVRGILCAHCNVVLGLVKEDVGTMQTMIEYVRSHNG